MEKAAAKTLYHCLFFLRRAVRLHSLPTVGLTGETCQAAARQMVDSPATDRCWRLLQAIDKWNPAEPAE